MDSGLPPMSAIIVFSIYDSLVPAAGKRMHEQHPPAAILRPARAKCIDTRWRRPD
jgi:hypothetical protein